MDETIRELQRRLDQALLAGDAGVLDELVSDDCRIIGPKGYFIPKAEWIDVHKSGDYQQIVLETSDQEIRTLGDAAVIWDVQRSQCRYRGATIDGNFRVSHVWARQGQRWQLVATQFTATTG
jgi:ketosteroid isomerase-like protein